MQNRRCIHPTAACPGSSLMCWDEHQAFLRDGQGYQQEEEAEAWPSIGSLSPSAGGTAASGLHLRALVETDDAGMKQGEADRKVSLRARQSTWLCPRDPAETLVSPASSLCWAVQLHVGCHSARGLLQVWLSHTAPPCPSGWHPRRHAPRFNHVSVSTSGC